MGWLDRWLEKDLTLKILAVALAVVLWLHVVSSQSPIVSVTVEGVTVRTPGLAPDLAVADLRPERVAVVVRAPRHLLDQLGPEDLRAEISLEGARAGHLDLPVRVRVPRGAQVLGVNPAQVQVTVDYLSERQVPVQVAVVGVVGEDYRVESPRPSPLEVLACGPRGQVARVRYAVGEADVTGATTDFLRTVTLRPVDGQGKEVAGVCLRPAEAEVKFTLVKLPPAKEVSVEPRFQGNVPLGYRLQEAKVSPPTVTIRGAREKLEAVQAISTKPINLEGVRTDTEREVGLQLPPDAVMVDPPTVLVYLRVAEDWGEKELTQLVEIRNLPAGWQGICEPRRVKVVVRGRKDLLETLALEVWVDANLPGGEHTARVQTRVSAGAEVIRIDPAEVKLSLSK